MSYLPGWGHAAALLALTLENTRGIESTAAHAAMIDRMSS